jgi:DNA-binding MarR family transcriptional regulator
LKVSKRLDQASLAETVGIDRINAADVLKRLEKAGLIKREPDRADQRVRLVSLTPKGAQTLKKIEPRARYSHDAILKTLTPAERKLLISFLQRMIIAKNGLGRAPLKISRH